MKYFYTFFLVLAVALSSPTQASWGKGKFQCLKTKAVQFDGTIAEAAIATPALSTLVTALTAANLVDAVNGAGNFTVFAPTNDAFNNVPGPILQALLDDSALLTTALLYHVIDGKVDARRPYFTRKVSTLAEQKVFLNRQNGAPFVNQSQVNCQGVKTSNGIVWIIDSVLLPQF
ncbi:fasciclin domain-containing protein [Thalassomonas viridans]|uniref:Fasciclin domain-containing protein n=1 Tax=Thalassomonas viridans TaxID=137584 RepID=A0AAE9Z5R0_9GAMM|nr:fasciclin domain-containing protein [Thalassomonas viridans]WDE06530.1 fasciclin domain-containing protein [Thalassomonas viridans]